MHPMDRLDARDWINRVASELYDRYESMDDAVGTDVHDPGYIADTKARSWKEARQKWEDEHYAHYPE